MRSLAFITALGLSLFGKAKSDGWPGNLCERAGGSCDPVTADFCQGDYDTTVGLPCAPRGVVGVGCCWHAPTPN
ncbi:hypothetical protein ACSS6W_010922 [Trichoderma asperelloides]|nr:hypothetical protein LI328DRAFT_166111 [Trichoderma asperelloides]